MLSGIQGLSDCHSILGKITVGLSETNFIVQIYTVCEPFRGNSNLTMGDEEGQNNFILFQPNCLNIPFPRALDMKGDLANNWKHFKSVWKNYEVATGLHEKDDNLRCATFLACRKRWNNWNAKRSDQDWIAWGKGKCWAWNPDVFSFSWGTSCARWTCL